MNLRQLIPLTMVALLVCAPMQSALAVQGGGHRGVGHGKGHGFGKGRAHGIRHVRGHGFGGGFGAGGVFIDAGWDLDDLYRELLNNLPFFALHPPVYYSYPVPRTYGYSPFAYPPHVMTPELVGEATPLEIINPHVPAEKHEAAKSASDRTAAATTRQQPEPLVILNPFVSPDVAVARN